MTVQADFTPVQVTLTTGTDVITVPNYVLLESELKVIRTRSGTNTTLTLNSHYTVTGEGDEGGCTVTMIGQTAGDTITIYRNMSFKQENDLLDGEKRSGPETEKVYDRLTMQDQQLKEQFDRCIRLPEGEDPGNSGELPDADSRKGKVLTFDPTNGLPTATDFDDIVVITGPAREYGTVAAMQADSTVSALGAGQSVLLKGYYASGDFGQPVPLIIETSTGGVKSHLLADGRYANLYVQDRINVNWLGAFASTPNTTDQREMIQDALDAASPLNIPVLFPAGPKNSYYYINSNHPTETDVGLLLEQNAVLIGQDYDNTASDCAIRAGTGLSGKLALVATEPGTTGVTATFAVTMEGMSFDANNQTQHAFLGGRSGEPWYIYNSSFKQCLFTNATASCCFAKLFLTVFDRCTASVTLTKTKSTWTNASRDSGGVIGFEIGGGSDGQTSLTMLSCYAFRCVIGYKFSDLVYSSFNALACDKTEVPYILTNCENCNGTVGSEISKTTLQATGCEGCDIKYHVVTPGVTGLTAEVDYFSDTVPDYLFWIENCLGLNLSISSISITGDFPSENYIYQDGSFVSYTNATYQTAPFVQTSGSYLYGNTGYLTPEHVSTPTADDGAVTDFNWFTMEGYEGLHTYLRDPYMKDTFGALSMYLTPDVNLETAAPIGRSLDMDIKLTTPIVYPDGNQSADFTEIKARGVFQCDNNRTGVCSQATPTTTNILTVGHGLSTSDVIVIGPDSPAYEGKHSVTVVDVDNFTITRVFDSTQTSAKWGTQAYKGVASITRQGDISANDILNVTLRSGVGFYNVPTSLRLQFRPNKLENYMVGSGTFVQGYTYRIDTLGSFDGSNVLPSGSSITFGDGSKVSVTQVGHGLTNNNPINVTGTTSYNGTKWAKVIDADTFELYESSTLAVATPYVADEVGSYDTNLAGASSFYRYVAKSTGVPTTWTGATVVAIFSAAERDAGGSQFSSRTLMTLKLDTMTGKQTNFPRVSGPRIVYL